MDRRPCPFNHNRESTLHHLGMINCIKNILFPVAKRNTICAASSWKRCAICVQFMILVYVYISRAYDHAWYTCAYHNVAPYIKRKNKTKRNAPYMIFWRQDILRVWFITPIWGFSYYLIFWLKCSPRLKAFQTFSFFSQTMQTLLITVIIAAVVPRSMSQSSEGSLNEDLDLQFAACLNKYSNHTANNEYTLGASKFNRRLCARLLNIQIVPPKQKKNKKRLSDFQHQYLSKLWIDLNML